MSIVDFIENKITESLMRYEDITEIVLDPEQYRELMREMSVNMYTMSTHMGNGNFLKRITFNSANGPIEIKVGKIDRQDPNNILKEIL